MLKLSTRGRYGVRLMLDLAQNYGTGPVALKEVAKRQGISEKYLERLIPVLKKAGVVRSSRGAYGGYVLSRSPEDINLLDIVLALEKSVCLVECTKKPSVCTRSSTCVTREIWKDIAGKIVNTLATCTLARMVRKQKRKIRGI